jgi:hypothetical protein
MGVEGALALRARFARKKVKNAVIGLAVSSCNQSNVILQAE